MPLRSLRFRFVLLLLVYSVPYLLAVPPKTKCITPQSRRSDLAQRTARGVPDTRGQRATSRLVRGLLLATTGVGHGGGAQERPAGGRNRAAELHHEARRGREVLPVGGEGYRSKGKHNEIIIRYKYHNLRVLVTHTRYVPIYLVPGMVVV